MEKRQKNGDDVCTSLKVLKSYFKYLLYITSLQTKATDLRLVLKLKVMFDMIQSWNNNYKYNGTEQALHSCTH